MSLSNQYLLSLCFLFSCTKSGDIQGVTQQPLIAQPSPWWEPLSPEPYLAQLSPEQKKEFEYATNELLCPCGEHTEVFADCIEKKSCPEALLAANMAARLLKENVPRNTTEALLAESFGAPPAAISVQDTPILGDVNAPITLVDFADFQCPYCAKLAVELHKVVMARPKEVRLVYKYFPIPNHPYGYLAAEAAAFAQTKNKFWELHDLLFARQKMMSRETILAWVSEIGLDPAELEAAWQQGTYHDRVKRDEAEGDNLKVGGTPTLYLNGRIYNEALTAEAISRAIDEVLLAQKATKR
jgi:protein-disulfide isomerase